jgi:hypothetical protein
MSNRVAESTRWTCATRNTRHHASMLFDHGNGSPAGGTFLFTASMFAILETTLEEGPEAGNHVISQLRTDPFMGPIRSQLSDMTTASATTGIRLSFYNGRGHKRRRIVDLRDRERGRSSAPTPGANHTWTAGSFTRRTGFLYSLRQRREPCLSGHTSLPCDGHRPLLAFRVRITHSRRQLHRLSIGINPDTAAQAPQYIRQSRQFRYAGGAFPCAKGENQIISR